MGANGKEAPQNLVGGDLEMPARGHKMSLRSLGVGGEERCSSRFLTVAATDAYTGWWTVGTASPIIRTYTR